jgi:hypothetical protein
LLIFDTGGRKMLLHNMDEAIEECPTVVLNDKQLRMAKVNEIEVGTEFTLTCKVVVKQLDESEGEDGTPEATAVFELSRISLEGDEQKKQVEKEVQERPVDRVRAFYPSMPQA